MDAVDTYQLLNVLELLVTEVDRVQRESSLYLPKCFSREANATGLGNSLQASGDVNAITKLSTCSADRLSDALD